MNKTEKKCCYIHCNNRAKVLCERVEVKTVMPKRKELSKIQSKLLVAWRHNGEAEFHKSCWDSIFVILRLVYCRSFKITLKHLLNFWQYLFHFSFVLAFIQNNKPMYMYNMYSIDWSQQREIISSSTLFYFMF